jgi:hypothetical protein
MPIQVHALIKDLAHHWWTPVPGTRYVCDGPDGLTDCGPGRIARDAPGSFNLYAGLMRLTLPSDYRFEDYKRDLHGLIISDFVSKQVVDGWSVECWATLLKPQAFKSFLIERRSQVEAWPWSQSGHPGFKTTSAFLTALPNEPWHPKQSAAVSPPRAR